MPTTVVDSPGSNYSIIGYERQFSDAAITASSEDTSDDGHKENISDSLTYSRWKSNGGGGVAEWIRGNHAVANDINFAAIIGHNLGTIGATLKFQKSDNAGVSWDDLTSLITPTDDSIIATLFDTVTTKDFRILVNTPAATEAEIGVCHYGDRMQMERGPVPGISSPYQARDTLIRNGRTVNGRWLPRSILRNGYQFELRFQDLTDTWYRANYLDFVEAAELDPFFYWWAPIDHPDEVVYCQPLEDGIKSASYTTPFHVNVSMRVRAIDQ